MFWGELESMTTDIILTIVIIVFYEHFILLEPT